MKNFLLNYQKRDILNSYLNIINNDNLELLNSIKLFIDYKKSLNDNSSDGKSMTKFSIMNKSIMGRKKCSILIDKVVAKLEQLIFEYNFIKKVVDNIDEKNNSDISEKLKKIVTSYSNKKNK